MGIPDYSVCHWEPEAFGGQWGARLLYGADPCLESGTISWGIAQARGSASDAGTNLRGIENLELDAGAGDAINKDREQ